MSRGRWMLGWGLLAATYLALGLRRVLWGDPGDHSGVTIYLVLAAVTMLVAWATLPIMAPRRRPAGPAADDSDGGGPGGGPGGGEPQPPWWPEFERAFRDHVRALEGDVSPADRAPERHGSG